MALPITLLLVGALLAELPLGEQLPDYLRAMAGAASGRGRARRHRALRRGDDPASRARGRRGGRRAARAVRASRPP